MFARGMGKLLALRSSFTCLQVNTIVWAVKASEDWSPIDGSRILRCAMCTLCSLTEAQSQILFNYSSHYEVIILTTRKTSSFDLISYSPFISFYIYVFVWIFHTH